MRFHRIHNQLIAEHLENNGISCLFFNEHTREFIHGTLSTNIDAEDENIKFTAHSQSNHMVVTHYLADTELITLVKREAKVKLSKWELDEFERVCALYQHFHKDGKYKFLIEDGKIKVICDNHHPRPLEYIRELEKIELVDFCRYSLPSQDFEVDVLTPEQTERRYIEWLVEIYEIALKDNPNLCKIPYIKQLRSETDYSVLSLHDGSKHEQQTFNDRKFNIFYV
jgi:hypothetical protein